MIISRGLAGNGGIFSMITDRGGGGSGGRGLVITCARKRK
jgi:hypothetical protein